MKTFDVTLKGVSPILMHAYPLNGAENIEKKTKEEQAEYSAYRIPETKELFLPAICLQRALVSAATFSKGKGRATLQRNAAAGLLVEPERIGFGVKKYAIDARPVVVPATKGRIMRFRPRLSDWKVQCKISYDENLLTEPQVRRILDDCGQRVGLLDFRPERKGPFGRFIVTYWEEK